MNQHDDGRGQDHGWEDPVEAGLLKQTFGAMAGGVDPASPTGPAATMTAMSRRVRRRRTAKLGGLGGGALALAGVLVLGAAQLAPPQQAQLLPGSSPVQASTPDFEVKEGYQPPWLDWSDLTCGMPVADLESTAQGWSVAPAGDIYARTVELGGEPSTSRGMAAAIEKGQGALDVAPVLVWSKDGVVLDLGPNVFGAPGEQSEPLLGGGEDAVAAEGGSASTCSPTPTDIDPVYESPLPKGDYDVQVVAFPEVASGERATAVSEPVRVRIDADGAHSPVEVRDDWVTMEYPEPHEGQVSRFEMERATGWVHAEMALHSRSSDAELQIIGYCVGSAMGTPLPIELVLPSTGKVLKTTQITCDGEETVAPVGVLVAGGEAIDIRIPEVPDDAMHFWVSLESKVRPPSTPVECSTTGMNVQDDLLDDLAQETWKTAASIVGSALACEPEGLISQATSWGTELMSGTETPEQVFAMPEDDAQHYRTLVALLADTRGVPSGGEQGNKTIVWPRVATEEFADSDEAWAEVVDAGLLTEAEAEAQRADGYQGMRIGIAEDGTWKYYSAGD